MFNVSSEISIPRRRNRMSEQYFKSDKNLANVNLEHGNVNIYMTENAALKTPDAQNVHTFDMYIKKLPNIFLPRRRCFLLTSHTFFTTFMSVIMFHIITKPNFPFFKTAMLKKQFGMRHLSFLKRNRSI